MSELARAPRFNRERPEVRRRRFIEAAARCLAQGGIQALTVDRIAAEAGVSRGLLSHYFTGKSELIVAVYERMTEPMTLAAGNAVDGDPERRLGSVIGAMFAPETFGPETLRVWLALWAEIAGSDDLRAAHRVVYKRYRKAMADALHALAVSRGRQIAAERLAASVIALIDGLWIESCLDPSLMNPQAVRRACLDMIEPHVGPVEG